MKFLWGVREKCPKCQQLVNPNIPFGLQWNRERYPQYPIAQLVRACGDRQVIGKGLWGAGRSGAVCGLCRAMRKDGETGRPMHPVRRLSMSSALRRGG